MKCLQLASFVRFTGHFGNSLEVLLLRQESTQVITRQFVEEYRANHVL